MIILGKHNDFILFEKRNELGLFRIDNHTLFEGIFIKAGEQAAPDGVDIAIDYLWGERTAALLPALLAGYNIAQFDLPFIAARAAIHDVPLPGWWPDLTRRYGICLDAFDVLGGSGKLAMWLARLKLPPKTGEGGQCHTYADEELRSYVQNDVRVERLLLRRLAGVSPLIRATKPETVPTP